jgi:hypothetical protein
VVTFIIFSKNLIPIRTLDAMATERKKLKISSFKKTQRGSQLRYLA